VFHFVLKYILLIYSSFTLFISVILFNIFLYFGIFFYLLNIHELISIFCPKLYFSLRITRLCCCTHRPWNPRLRNDAVRAVPPATMRLSERRGRNAARCVVSALIRFVSFFFFLFRKRNLNRCYLLGSVFQVLAKKKTVEELITKARAQKDHLAPFPAFRHFHAKGNVLDLLDFD